MENIIDQLGTVNQQIKELETFARELKQELIARGVGVFEGEHFVAEVQSYEKEVISPRLVRETFDEDLVKAVTAIQHVDAVVVKAING